MKENLFASATEKLSKPVEITVAKIDKENPLERRKLRKIFDNPKTNRHIVDTDDGQIKTKSEKDQEFRDWLKENNNIYGIYKTVNGRQKLISAAYFYPYEEEPAPSNEKLEDHSETVREMIDLGIISNSQVPKVEGTGDKIDYGRIQEASIFIPENTNIEELGQGFAKVMQEYIKDNQLPENTLIFFFKLQNQSQSTAKKSDHVLPNEFKKELAEEKRILKKAGFAHWEKNLEHGDVGVSTFFVYRK